MGWFGLDLAAHPAPPPAMGRDTLLPTLSSLALVGSECSALPSSKLGTFQFTVIKSPQTGSLRRCFPSALQEAGRAGREGSPQFLAEVQHSGVLRGGVKPVGFIVIYSHFIMGQRVAWISKS